MMVKIYACYSMQMMLYNLGTQKRNYDYNLNVTSLV